MSVERAHAKRLPHACTMLVMIAMLVTPSFARADELPMPPPSSMTDTTRGLAMGTGGRASAASTAALSYNPAGLATGRLYHLEGSVMYEPSWGRFAFTSSVVDSMTSKLAAGLSVRGILSDGERGYSGIDGRAAIGIPLSDAISLGVAGRYFSLTAENDADPMIVPSGLTIDASLRVSPSQGLHIAAFGYNLIDMHSPLAPVMLGGGLSYTVGDTFTIASDILFDMSTFERAEMIVGGGFEYLSSGSIPIRLGYAFDAGRETHSVTGGLGYVDQKVGIDVSLRQQVSGGDDTIAMASVRYFIQ